MARLIPNGGYHGTSQAVAVDKSGSFVRQNSAYTLRIAVLGECGVGKTTLIHHLITGQFRNQLSLSLNICIPLQNMEYSLICHIATKTDVLWIFQRITNIITISKWTTT